MSDSIGMMGGAFFVPRTEVIAWINDLLKVNITRIEQLGTGAIYCQLFDTIYPGKVPVHKINWKAKQEWEFIQNFKILQQSFDRCNIKKHIEVERLIKAKYQDNLEFAQWMKKFYDLTANKEKQYDASSKRKDDPDFTFVDLKSPPKRQDKPYNIEDVLAKKRAQSLKRERNNLSFRHDAIPQNAKGEGVIIQERDSYYMLLKNIQTIVCKNQEPEKDVLDKIKDIVKDFDQVHKLSNNTVLEVDESKESEKQVQQNNVGNQRENKFKINNK